MTASRNEAWERLAKALNEGDDYAWLDELPEGDDLPEERDDTRALVFEKKPERL